MVHTSMVTVQHTFLRCRKLFITGTIKMGGEVYHVEPARRHFKRPQSFHSVIYKVSDVKANYNYGHDAMRIKKRPTSYKVKSERDSLKPDITR